MRVGIVGQSFSATTPRDGKRDKYPGSNAGRFKTSAMAEGGGSEGEWVATAMHAALSHLVEVAAAS